MACAGPCAGGDVGGGVFVGPTDVGTSVAGTSTVAVGDGSVVADAVTDGVGSGAPPPPPQAMRTAVKADALASSSRDIQRS
jgi:hypothetical protein